MDKRGELITSIEYWVVTISTALFHNKINMNNSACDIIAEKVVDEHFMKVINEIVGVFYNIDEKSVSIIDKLDEYAIRKDAYEYGLPLSDKHVKVMTNIIKGILNGTVCKESGCLDKVLHNGYCEFHTSR